MKMDMSLRVKYFILYKYSLRHPYALKSCLKFKKSYRSRISFAVFDAIFPSSFLTIILQK